MKSHRQTSAENLSKPCLNLDQLEALRRLETCAVANAIDNFEIRLRNEGYADSTIRCLFPRMGAMAGYAATLRIRCSTLPPTGRRYVDRTDWWSHVLAVPEPRVVVIEDVDTPPGVGAFLGEVHSQILRALGCVGAVTNGAVRDLPAVARIPFHFFAGSVAVSHAYAHIVEIGSDVTVGALKINPGDLLHGDQHGLLSVPKKIAGRIPAMAAKNAEHERKLIALCRGGDFTLEQLEAAVKD
jgi:4-hydroxy-4-methyl-2-oxoglutarate aldolase